MHHIGADDHHSKLERIIMVVKKEICGKSVEAHPKFKDGCEPDYWIATVNNSLFPRKFSSPTELFHIITERLSNNTP